MDDSQRQTYARQNCRVKGGDLVSIHDDETTNFLVHIVTEIQNVRKQNVWIGLIRTRKQLLFYIS